jgi:hypothetical protein
MSIGLADFWKLDISEIAKILESGGYSPSGNNNYDRAIAITILYNKRALSRQIMNNMRNLALIEHPNFIKAMESTTSLEAGEQLLFVNEVDIFNDQNVVKLLEPYYKRDAMMLSQTVQGLELSDGTTKKIIFNKSTNIFNAIIKGDKLFIKYSDNDHHLNTIFDVINITTGEVLLKRIFAYHTAFEFVLSHDSIYLNTHHTSVEVLNIDTLESNLLIFDDDTVSNIIVSTDGQTVVFVTVNRMIYVMKEGQTVMTMSYGRGKIVKDKRVESGLIADDKLWLVLYNNSVYVYDLLNGKLLNNLYLYTGVYNEYEYGYVREHPILVVYKNFMIYSNGSDNITIRDINQGYRVIRKNQVGGILFLVEDLLYSVNYSPEGRCSVKVYDLTLLPGSFEIIDEFRPDNSTGFIAFF